MQKRIFIATTLILFATNAMAANIYDHYVGNTKTGLWEEVAVPNAYDFTHFRSSSQLGAEGEFTFNFDQANKSMCSNWQYDLKLHFLKADNNIKDTMKVTVHYADGAAILFVNAWADDPEPSFRSYQNLGYFAGVTAVAISNLSVQQTSDNSVIKYAIADVLQYNPVNTNEECIPMVPSDTSTGNVDSIPPDTIPKLPMGINVSSSRTISSHQGGFNFDLSKDANFGQLIAALGDADNNGV
ncbi:MAG: hypothetical protein HRT35_31995, partial [Algicola sp.]|nr:hypothetical protein [Algicola sp.]